MCPGDTSQVAKGLDGKQIPASTVRHMRGHKLAPTCVVLSPDDSTAFSGSKDNSIMRWDVETGKRITMLPYWRKLPGGKVPTVKAHSKEVRLEHNSFYIRAILLYVCPWPFLLCSHPRVPALVRNLLGLFWQRGEYIFPENRSDLS